MQHMAKSLEHVGPKSMGQMKRFSSDRPRCEIQLNLDVGCFTDRMHDEGSKKD